MNLKLNLFTLTILLILSNCNNGNSTNESITKSLKTDNISSSKPEYDNNKIKMIDRKKEARSLDGNFNQMTIFEVNKDISMDELKQYCSAVKPQYNDGYFQILVFFKNNNTARFPDNIITGMYLENEDMKNIKAVYTINNTNGYSKLDYYKKNSLESLAQEIVIY